MISDYSQQKPIYSACSTGNKVSVTIESDKSAPLKHPAVPAHKPPKNEGAQRADTARHSDVHFAFIDSLSSGQFGKGQGV